MTPQEFVALVERLTGSPTKGLRDEDRSYLKSALEDGAREIDASQFNELLLIVNKDRVTPAFFKFFFCPTSESRSLCTIEGIAEAVTRFQQTAMLCFGNFIYAYRRLSKCRDITKLVAALGRYGERADQLEFRLKTRRPAVLDVEPIARDETYFNGYLSATELVGDQKRGAFFKTIVEQKPEFTWEDVRNEIASQFKDEEIAKVERTADALRKRVAPNGTPADLKSSLSTELEELTSVLARLKEVRAEGARNTDVYLTWDHMDVYFATSMRKRWEYEDLFDFVSELVSQSELKEINVRHFDPTQSYDKDRISKGLVESLMLKRALCTVYAVQDTDTLGKDSELAATLAQGKPVIAYAPRIDVKKRAAQLQAQRPQALKERLRFIVVQDASISQAELEEIEGFLEAVEDFECRMPWRSIAPTDALTAFQSQHSAALERTCTLLATSESRLYDRRAALLQKDHPLAIQVNLDSGVANGVLVVRDVATCAKLVRAILTNSLQFDIDDDAESDCWLLRERLSGSIFRVVTRNQKLTNCFWNFYRDDTQLGADHGGTHQE